MGCGLSLSHAPRGESGCLHEALFLCSAGAGRTGTFIALSNILERVKAEGLLDVFQAVKSLRLQRPHMVQTLVRNAVRRMFAEELSPVAFGVCLMKGARGCGAGGSFPRAQARGTLCRDTEWIRFLPGWGLSPGQDTGEGCTRDFRL